MTPTFADDFAGTTLDPAKWGQNYKPSGLPRTQFDKSLATVSGGYLHLRATLRNGLWYSTSVDTKLTFKQRFGRFGARVRVPAGRGFWLGVLWGYDDATGQEIDHEVYANPKGSVPGHDVCTDRCTVHFSNTAGDESGAGARTVDLSAAFHDYEYDWRAGRITWYLDGKAVRTYSGPRVPSVALPLICDFGIGNRASIGIPDATTPPQAEMLVDRVWALP